MLMWLAIWDMLVYHYRASDSFVLGCVMMLPCGIGMGAFFMVQRTCSINLSDGCKILCGAVVLWCIVLHVNRGAIRGVLVKQGALS